MSVSANLIGMPAGGGGSFPMAGTRPKIRKVTTYTPGTYTWVAPQNVFFISLTMCGGGGGAGGNGYYIPYAASTVGGFSTSTIFYQLLVAGSGGAATCIPPTVIPVTPGAVYTIVVGASGSGGTTTRHTSVFGNVTSGSATGSNGGVSSFRGDMITVYASGGLGWPSSSGGSAVGSTGTFGFPQVAGASGSTFRQTFGDASADGQIIWADIGGGFFQTYGAGQPATFTNAGILQTSSVEFSRQGTSALLSASKATATSIITSYRAPGGAPSLFSDGAPSVATTASAKPPTSTTAYGVGGAANALIYPSGIVDGVTLTGTWTIDRAFAFMTTGTTASGQFGYGGDGGPGMVRIIWEE